MSPRPDRRRVKLMDKVLEIGKISASGSFKLFVGTSISTIVMAIGTIILARVLTPDEYGLYSVALIPLSMIILFRDWGVNSAITKYLVNCRTENRNDKMRNVIIGGLCFEVVVGLALSILSFLSASLIATTVFQRPESSPLIAIVSVAVFSGSLIALAQSSFIGSDRMGLNSFVAVFQSIVKSVVGPVLIVVFGYGVLGAVVGYSSSFLLAGILSCGILYFALIRNLPKSMNGPKESSLSETLKSLLRYGVPLSISTIIGGFSGQFYGFMMASFCDNTMIGNFQIALNFAILLTFITGPISTVLFPAFAKLDLINDHQLLRSAFSSSVKYGAFLLLPATLAVMVLSEPMVSVLFGEKWVYSAFFLTLYAANNLLAFFGNLSLGSFLFGLGETKMLMKLGLITTICGVPLAFLLVPSFGILGVILGGILSGLPGMCWGLYWIWKRYGVRADFGSSARILLASAMAAAATLVFLDLFRVTEWLRLVAGGTIFIAVYIVSAPLVGAINQNDTKILKVMLGGLGIVSWIVNMVLAIMEKLTLHNEEARARNK